MQHTGVTLKLGGEPSGPPWNARPVLDRTVISRTRRFCRALTVEAIATASLAEDTLHNRDN
jgi:hypothetical protein